MDDQQQVSVEPANTAAARDAEATSCGASRSARFRFVPLRLLGG